MLFLSILTGFQKLLSIFFIRYVYECVCLCVGVYMCVCACVLTEARGNGYSWDLS